MWDPGHGNTLFLMASMWPLSPWATETQGYSPAHPEHQHTRQPALLPTRHVGEL